MNIFFIGTLHNMKESEHLDLIELVKSLNPTIVLLEITQEDLSREKIKTYPKEMQAVFSWARVQKIDVLGFDIDISVFKLGVDPDLERKVIQEQVKFLGTRDWREANKADCDHLSKIAAPLIDSDKWELRQKGMLENIERFKSHRGNTVIVTGVGHLAFFEKAYDGSLFPLRGGNGSG